MAYADFEFYQNIFYGDILTEENANRWLERASDRLDTLTHGRLGFAYPTEEAHVVKVQKAVCAMAEALWQVETQRAALSAQKAQDGSFRGAVTSISSGKESVSYATGSAVGSAFAAAAASKAEETVLLQSVAAEYLANVPDANGVNLLYAGVCPGVR